MKFTTSVRVRYAETDQMGVAYHSNYFIWFEVGRVELMRSLGFSYVALEKGGCGLPVVEAMCRYRGPARYDDLLTIETTVQALRGSIVIFSYVLRRGVDLLAEAETKHVAVDRDLKPRRLPEQEYAALLLTLS